MHKSSPRAPIRAGLGCVLLLNACSTVQRATEPVEPYPAAVSARVPVPDSVLSRAIKGGELIVLATPVELASQHGVLTPRFSSAPRKPGTT